MYKISDNVIIKKMKPSKEDWAIHKPHRAINLICEDDIWVAIDYNTNKIKWIDMDAQTKFESFASKFNVLEFHCMDVSFSLENIDAVFEIFNNIKHDKNEFIAFDDEDEKMCINPKDYPNFSALWVFHTLEISDILYLQLKGTIHDE